ncbi:Retrotransposon protein, Ty3-gypsy subclass [Gossypium australe]|uniref:Retrotransposon protein, Ty3-gypsy subclass n=1 Tax=Gossypium australe TaxID=47621 RepID=A0A5B6WI84_9ROSI|nr:Retrotransposon protein, Ty3-gypsy subclass [Gossypium australe]
MRFLCLLFQIGILVFDFGTQFAFSAAFRPQTDVQSERVIQILKDMLRRCDRLSRKVGGVFVVG